MNGVGHQKFISVRDCISLSFTHDDASLKNVGIIFRFEERNMGCTLVFVVAYVSSRTRLWRNWAEVSLLTGESGL